MKTITICSSMAFYKDVILLGETLEEKGWRVLYPETSLEMKKRNDYNVDNYKKSITPQKKKRLIKLHFDKIIESDCILVINKTKNGFRGYIGPNVLMEIGLAFAHSKKAYILNPVPKTSPFIEELTAMSPKIIKGDLSAIKS